MTRQPSSESVENELLRDAFCAIVPDDVLLQDSLNNVYLGGQLVKADEAMSLQKDAEYLKQSRLWSILTNSLVDQAHKVMFDKSENFDDMRNGKMMLYNIGVQKAIVERICNFYKKKKEDTRLQKISKDVK